MQRIVFTGGPGAGKTTVLEMLRGDGFAAGQDAARSIIRERKAAGLSPRPEPRAFAEQILANEIATYRWATGSPTFFERGVVDAVGFLLGAGELDEAAAGKLVDTFRYDRVFLFPPWAEIFCTDEERDHDFDHAVRVHGATRDLYARFGYEIIEVPLSSARARAEFVLEHAGIA